MNYTSKSIAYEEGIAVSYNLFGIVIIFQILRFLVNYFRDYCICYSVRTVSTGYCGIGFIDDLLRIADNDFIYQVWLYLIASVGKGAVRCYELQRGNFISSQCQ